MSHIKFIILGIFLAGSSYCMSPKCYRINEIECQEYKIKEWPKDVEGLRNFCNDIIPLGHCTLRVMEKCVKDAVSHDDEEDVKKFRNTLEFIKSSCDDDSPVFKAIADNFLCVSSTFHAMDDICLRGGLNTTSHERLYYMEKDDDLPGCMIDAWIFYCTTARYDVECGSEVRNAIAEIIDNTDYLSTYCKSVRDEVPYIEEAFKSEFRRGKSGEDALPVIMESISKMLE